MPHFNHLRVTGTPGNEPEEENNEDRPAQGDQDRVDQTARRSQAKVTGNEAAHQRAHDTEQDVEPESVPATAHELACGPTGDETNEDPPYQVHISPFLDC